MEISHDYTNSHKDTHIHTHYQKKKQNRIGGIEFRISSSSLTPTPYRQDKGNKPRERKRERQLLLSNRITSNNSNIHREKINASGERERKRVVASGAVS